MRFSGTRPPRRPRPPRTLVPRPPRRRPAADTTTQQPVDVEAVLNEISSDKGNPDLNWKSSIVDLMKLLGIDSSLHNREALADELGYTGGEERQRRDEHLAAQGDDEGPRRQRRPRSGQHAGLVRRCKRSEAIQTGDVPDCFVAVLAELTARLSPGRLHFAGS